MKKALALALALILCLGTGILAFADADYDDYANGTNGTQDMEIYMAVPEKITDNPSMGAGNPSNMYYECYDAEDLKASIEWNDGKKYFDSVEIEDVDENPDLVKVTVKFKEYYGVEDIDIDFDLTMKHGSSKKEFTIVGTAAGVAEVFCSPDDSRKVCNVQTTFGWDWLDTAASDEDDGTGFVVSDGIPGAGITMFRGGADVPTAVVFDDDSKTYMTFEFENCEALSVAGKMSKQAPVNMYLDTAVTDEIKALMKKNEDVDFDVIDFKGAPEFDFTQEVTYYIDDEDVEYFVYEIVDGKPVAVKAKLNDDKDALVWKTRTLGTYIVTDDKIEAAAAETEPEGGKENPETGAAGFAGVAVVLAVAGAVALKK
ncbi:MAG: hypothetical protein MR014_00360 [Oscillospiraceae bacterium]|nr:hypothetical protein [Oscillospiraceae bacterium]